ncbi:MAG: DUF5009 domain-containing protein [Actinobacteria bacterium]|nr:DUF5009 domain-containing protein [Cyanobacteriota bacterium]MCL5772039.1 DUF5009 domain-containing protein [Actinomycetota bacterium]
MDNRSKSFSNRILSIDALRGFDMFWIMGSSELVIALLALSKSNWAMQIAAQFRHSIWNGFTFYDLIFPLFLFIVGLTIPFSLTKYYKEGKIDFKHAYIRIITRTVILFFLGLCINGFLDFSFTDMRWPGVLQRIAICYFLAAIITLNVPSGFQTLVIGVLIAIILIAYWLVMRFVTVPGVTAADYLSKEGNLAGYIDRLIIPGRLYYKYGDNEGLISTLPALCTTLFGVISGRMLKSNKSQIYKMLWMIIFGFILLIIGIVWSFVFPLNKILWTSSFTLVTAGCSLLLLCLFYWLIDYKGYKKWAFPFIVIGMNAITIYIVQGLFDFGIIVNIVVHGFIGYMGPFKDIFFLICLILLKWLFLYFLYKKKIFLKV